MTPCMGGFCRARAACPNYTDADRGNPDSADVEPAERLCPPGRDGKGLLCEMPTESNRQQPYQVPA